jgi:hypothetical protein
VTVIVAKPDLVVSVADVAVSVTVKVAATDAGAVYVTAVPEALDAAERVPQVAALQGPPMVDSTQLTPPSFASLVTLAVNGVPVVLPAAMLAVGGNTFTEIGGVIVIVAALDLVASATDVATSVTVNVAAAAVGAVYVMGVPETLEEAERVPQVVVPLQVRPVEDSVHFTPALLESFVTVAENGTPVGLLAAIFTVEGATLTVMAGVTVIVAKLDLVESVTDVAVSLTVRVDAAEGGDVYVMGVAEALEEAERLPQVVVPLQVRPADESVHFTPALPESLLTVAVKGIPVRVPASKVCV